MNLTETGFEIQGISLTRLAEKYGAPLFVYDADKIVSQYHKLKQAFKVKHLKINYACKALSSLAVLRLMRELGAGLDTVSFQEVLLGLEAGFTPDQIMYTPNSVSVDEMEEAINMGVRLNVDNLETLEYMGINHNQIPFCIRINPHIMAGGNKNISVGHIDSKFGISIHMLPMAERLIKTLGIRIEGIHMHTGSDILDAEVFLYAAEILFGLVPKFPELKYIDFGSGFKVKYKDADIETNIEDLGARLSARFNEVCAELGRELTLEFEPGKFLVSDAGVFLAKTNVVKRTTSTVFACLDTGFNHLIRPMFYNAYHEIHNASNPAGEKKIYTVVGYICETDTFGWNRMIAEIKKDDLLLFKNAGAYCYSMASNYNSRFRPAEVLIIKGQDYLIRKRENMDDLTRNQLVPQLDAWV